MSKSLPASLIYQQRFGFVSGRYQPKIFWARADLKAAGSAVRTIILFGRQELSPQNSGEVTGIIEEIINDTDSRATQISITGDDLLIVNLNAETGYGAMVWIDASKEGIHGRRVWVSDNPSPPQSDPRVFADLESATFHSRLSTLTVGDVQTALEEYFETGTGARPESILWIKGHMTGERIDGVGGAFVS